MTPADRVYEHLQHLPESVVAEGLDFVQFLEQKHQRSKLYKQFSDNPDFKRWLTDRVFESTYRPEETLRG